MFLIPESAGIRFLGRLPVQEVPVNVQNTNTFWADGVRLIIKFPYILTIIQEKKRGEVKGLVRFS